MRVAAVVNVGNFSSKLLDDRNVTAIVTEKAGAGILTAQDIQHALHSSGIGPEQGLVVVRSGSKTRVEVHDADIVDVETEGELQQDHESCRTSIHQVAEMLKGFIKAASTAHSKFHTEKADGNPAVLHVSGTAGFEKAKEAVERDLKEVMKVHQAQTAQTKSVVYSVHFSDVNGLSRLENYIIAGEIAQYLGKSGVEDNNKVRY